MKWILAPLLLVGCSAAAAPVGGPAAVDHALREIARELQAGGKVTCKPESNPPGIGCFQEGLSGDRYGVAGVSFRPAARPMVTGSIRTEDALVGPGGGSASYVGQTADHRYDIVAVRGDQMGEGDRSRLPPAERLIARAAALYAAAER